MSGAAQDQAEETQLLDLTRQIVDAFWNRAGLAYTGRLSGDTLSNPSPIRVNGPDEQTQAVLAHITGRRVPVVELHDRGEKSKLYEGARICLGMLALDESSKGRWVCIDIDGGRHSYALADPWSAAQGIAARAQAVGLTPMIERSKSGQGWHVWVFAAEPLPGRDLRELGLRLCPPDPPRLADPERAGQEHADAERNRGLEVLPKQPTIEPDGGYGSMVWLPLWHKGKDGGGRFVEVGPDGQPVDVELTDLVIERHTPADIEAALDRLLEQEPERFQRTTPPEDDPSGRERVTPGPGAQAAWYDQVKAGGLESIVRVLKLKHKRVKDRIVNVERCPACNATQRSSSDLRMAVGCYREALEWRHLGSRPDGKHCGQGGDALSWAVYEAVGSYPPGGDLRWQTVKAWCLAKGLYTEHRKAAEHMSSGGGQRARSANDPNNGPADDSDSRPLDDWTSDLPWVFDKDRQCNVVDSKVSALRLILNNDPALVGVIAHNELAHAPMMTRRAPFLPTTIRDPQSGYPRQWAPTDDALLTAWLEMSRYKMTPTDGVRAQALATVAAEHAYHPIRTWLAGLAEWDGVPRIDRWLIDAMGAKDTAYVRAVSRKWLIGAVARVERPGCKFDSVLALMGSQGLGKSSLLALLAHDPEWSSDGLQTFDGPRAIEALDGRWILELGELAALGKAEVETAKKFLTQTADVTRRPYERRPERVPRQCVFAATTNKSAFLVDTSGGRRFWPVLLVKKLDRAAFKAIVPQLWAEALAAYRNDEQLHLDEAMETEASRAQEAVFDVDAWEDATRAFVGSTSARYVSLPEVAYHALGITTDRLKHNEKTKLGGILDRMGWGRGKARLLPEERVLVSVSVSEDRHGTEFLYAKAPARPQVRIRPEVPQDSPPGGGEAPKAEDPQAPPEPSAHDSETQARRGQEQSEQPPDLAYVWPMSQVFSEETFSRETQQQQQEEPTAPPPPEEYCPSGPLNSERVYTKRRGPTRTRGPEPMDTVSTSARVWPVSPSCPRPPPEEGRGAGGSPPPHESSDDDEGYEPLPVGFGQDGAL